jgi:hypothetical protein
MMSWITGNTSKCARARTCVQKTAHQITEEVLYNYLNKFEIYKHL